MIALLTAILIKGSILMIAAAAAVALVSRASAATRHFIWTLTIVGLLALPVFSTMVPAWEFSVPVASLGTDMVTDVARGTAAMMPATVRVSAPGLIDEQPSAGARLSWPAVLV